MALDPLLYELQAADPLSLCFNHIGFGSALSPEDAARHQARSIASATLVDEVPEAIRENFERARKLHLYGVLEYEFFTAASDYALLVLEAALRVRFLSYYDHRVPVYQGGQPAVLEVTEFDEVFTANRIKLRRDGERETFPKYLRALLRWARGERLLPGKRSQMSTRLWSNSATTLPIPPGARSMAHRIRPEPSATSPNTSTAFGECAAATAALRGSAPPPAAGRGGRT